MKIYPTLNSNLTFEEYIAKCRSIIQDRRPDLSNRNENKSYILDANSPFELAPNTASSSSLKYGALLVHGLFDCPFSLRELGSYLQINGIASKSILLPGHGTMPSDLLKVSYLEWIDAVRYGIEILQQEVDKLFLIGYSTGGALSIYQALKNSQISGIVLLAPAIKIKTPIDLIVAWRYLKKWTKKNPEWIYCEKESDYTRYQSIAFNPVLQLAKLIDDIETLQQQHSLACPMFIAISREDEIVSSDAAMDFFSNCHHPDSQLLLYTSRPRSYPDSRILIRPTEYPSLNINHLSHISIPFSPQNNHYGQHGDYIFASHPEPRIVYGAYNIVEEKIYALLQKFGLIKRKRHALTYNPDFDFLAEKILKFIYSC